MFPVRISETLIVLEPILEPEKPPAGVHVANAMYLCTLRLFLRLQTSRRERGGMMRGVL